MIDKNDLIEVVKLPWPPSTNALHRYSRNGVYNDPKYKRFKRMAKIAWLEQGMPKIRYDLVDVVFVLFPPDFRSYDTDNRCKSTQDAMTEIRVWQDDKIVKNVHLIPACAINEGGAVVAEIYKHKNYNIRPEKYGFTEKIKKRNAKNGNAKIRQNRRNNRIGHRRNEPVDGKTFGVPPTTKRSFANPG